MTRQSGEDAGFVVERLQVRIPILAESFPCCTVLGGEFSVWSFDDGTHQDSEC